MMGTRQGAARQTNLKADAIFADERIYEKLLLLFQDEFSGESAYQIAVDEGFEGTPEEWLDSLQGEDGEDGEDGDPGISAYQVALNNGFEGSEPMWLESLKGANGNDGASAYEIAMAEGFVGTEEEWLESLQGADGDDGDDGASAYEIAVDNGFEGTEEQWLESLQGTDGEGLDATGVGEGRVPTADGDDGWSWEEPPAGGGGSGATRDTDTLTTSSLASAASETVDIDLGASYRVLRMEADVACRVTLYLDAATAAADSARPMTILPTGSHGVLLDVALAAGVELPIAFPMSGFTLDATTNRVRVTNLSGSTTVINVDIEWLQWEA